MPHANGGHHQGGREHAHGRGHGPIAQGHTLAKHDVQRPANAGREGEEHAHRVQRRGRIGPRKGQQQGQAHNGQRDPQPVAGFFGGPDGHGQRPGELDGDGHAEGDGLDRAVKQQVHHAQRDAIQAQRQRIGPDPLSAPGPEHGHEHEHGKHDAVSGGALGPQRRKQAFGERGAHRQGHQTAQQGQHGPQTKIQTRPLYSAFKTMGWPCGVRSAASAQACSRSWISSGVPSWRSMTSCSSALSQWV